MNGHQLAIDGMNQALEHAEEVYENWGDHAFEMLKRYPGEQFMAEDVREWAESMGFPSAPSNRAWGGVIARARRAGIIRRIGYRAVNNPKAHRTPATLWGRVNA